MKKLLLLFTILIVGCSLAFSQQHVISGRILGKDGSPIPFASIQVKGTTQGTTSDQNGHFSLSVPANAVLKVSFVGFIPQQINVGDQTSLNVTLNPNTNALDVLVVTALGIKRQSKEIGYSTANIGNKELTQAKVTDLSTGLTGKVSGLQINLPNNGIDPQTRIVLRGNRSFLGNNQALIVINGVPMPDNYNVATLDPNDIASVNVIKGQAGAALYGSRASNGVLIITTKTGHLGKPTITVSNTTTFQSVDYLPKFQYGFSSYGGEADVTDGFGNLHVFLNPDGTPRYVPFENEAYGPPFSGVGTVMLGGPALVTKNGTSYWDTLNVPFKAVPNGIQNFFQTGVTNQLNVGYSSGDDNGSFYMGAQHVNSTGVVPNAKKTRDNVTFNGVRKDGIFTVQYNVGYTISNVTDIGPGYSQQFPLYEQILDNPTIYDLSKFKDYLNNPHATVNGFSNDYNTNPWEEVNDSKINYTTNNLLGSFQLSLQPTSWLNLSDRVGATIDNIVQKNTQAAITFAPWAIADPTGGGAWPSALRKVNGQDVDYTNSENILNNDFLATFNKKFHDFSVNLILGGSVTQQIFNEQQLSSSTLLIPGFYNISSGSGVPGFFQNKFEERNYAYYEDLTLGYKGFLYVNATNRDEWNSILAPGHQHYEYPSVNGSFIFSNAIKGLNDSRILSYGKLTAAWSTVGNISLNALSRYGAYDIQNTFNLSPGFPYGGLGGYTLSNTSFNQNITPEKTVSDEFGLSMGFLDNRIGLDLDYYHMITSNQTLPAEISHATGYDQVILNTGEMLNEGEEVDLKITPVRTTDFRWDVSFHYSHNHNEVLSILPAYKINSVQVGGYLNDFLPALDGGIYAQVGQPYPIIKVSDWARDPQGQVIVDPISGFPSVDHSLKNFGNTNPTDILGVSTSLTFKGLSLNLVADYRGGYYIMNSIGRDLDFIGTDYHSITNGRQRIIFPNSAISLGNGKYQTNTSVATYDGSDPFWTNYYGTGIGSPYVTSAAFWKLREAALTYQLPQRWMHGTGFIRGMSISLVGNNLLMWRPATNTWTDPEFSEGNGNATGRTSIGETPPTRSYGFNLTMTF
ncbi:MAG: SusC/RagA family TonB-linked outer membrane protein [Chitinophagaceae bacterium]